MSRMASMQVLNQAFANANAAFNAYMRNKNEERRSDLAEEFGRLDRQYRAEQALQQQANLDRMYALATARDAQAQANADRSFYANQAAATQAQKNWQKTFDAKNKTADYTHRANKMRMFADILKVAPDAGTAETMINQMGVGFDDPVLQGAFLTDWYKRKAVDKFATQWEQQVSELNKMKLALAASQQKAQEAQAKLAQQQRENNFKNAMPFITAAMGNATTDNPFDVAKAVNDFNTMKALLNAPNAPQVPYAQGVSVEQNAMTPEQALQAYKDGKITKEQLAELRKNF